MSPTLEQVNPPMHVAVRWVKEVLPVNNLSFNSTHYGTFWDDGNQAVFKLTPIRNTDPYMASSRD